jgi:hypothetical protein
MGPVATGIARPWLTFGIQTEQLRRFDANPFGTEQGVRHEQDP